MSRRRVAAAMELRRYVRTPVALALLVVLPAYFVLTAGHLTPAAELPTRVPGAGTRPVPLAEGYAVLMAPIAAALVGGVTGLFLTRASLEADARLTRCGYRRHDLLGVRLGLLGGVAALAAGTATGAVLTVFVPAAPGPFALAVFLTALAYGLVGVLVGTLVDRLFGVYLLLFVPTLDVFLLQNPSLGVKAPGFAALSPAHFPVEAAVDAAFGSGFSPAPLVPALAYLLVLAALTVVVYTRRV